MKSGGATIRVLHTPMPNQCDGNAENYQGRMISASKAIGAMGTPGSELDGYIVVGLFSDGSTSMGYRIPERLPRALVPSYFAEVFRRDIITDKEAERVFDEKFE